MVDLGARVRARRSARGLSIEELAAHAGVSYSTIVRLERGYIPRADRLAKIASLLETTVEELLGGEAA